MTHRQELCRPLAPFTTNWEAARRSTELLAELNPSAVCAGHGVEANGIFLSR